MTENIRQIKKDLQEAGIELHDIRIKNYWTKRQGQRIQISIFNKTIPEVEKYLKFRIIRKLIKSGFGVITTEKRSLFLVSVEYPFYNCLTITNGNEIKTLKQFKKAE